MADLGRVVYTTTPAQKVHVVDLIVLILSPDSEDLALEVASGLTLVADEVTLHKQLPLKRQMVRHGKLKLTTVDKFIDV